MRFFLAFPFFCLTIVSLIIYINSGAAQGVPGLTLLERFIVPIAIILFSTIAVCIFLRKKWAVALGVITLLLLSFLLDYILYASSRVQCTSADCGFGYAFVYFYFEIFIVVGIVIIISILALTKNYFSGSNIGSKKIFLSIASILIAGNIVASLFFFNILGNKMSEDEYYKETNASILEAKKSEIGFLYPKYLPQGLSKTKEDLPGYGVRAYFDSSKNKSALTLREEKRSTDSFEDPRMPSNTSELIKSGSFEEILINGVTGYYFVDGNKNAKGEYWKHKIWWSDQDRKYRLSAVLEISKEDLIKIAESVKP